ncbi:D-alanine--D-alanine ligase [Leptospira hartskeerlii]|uniref:D-alanine--D-alanine ligase n=1 Tax=Leptospira hartskeerlii TaxID=2023177 RepID=A0A2M9X9W1_9LEPT|nr:D-alanine--D-alanine ligase [Leptospira hartskeerlii]PJZ24481.1 D-alanine--D-alanine ligase [Leptospira hartskeerlii]PJZ32907.1 D-alanine--D-alanine ligase [Leptospira hartskeerlii]
MNSDSPSVLIVADIQNPNLDLKDTQEWEDMSSVQEIKRCLEDLGEKVEVVEFPSKLLQKLSDYSNLEPQNRPVLFHLVEGFRSRNREALLPAIAEYSGFPHTGSDAYAQNLSLDKHLSKLFCVSAGVPTSPWTIWEKGFVEVTTSFQNGAQDSKGWNSDSIFRGARFPLQSEFPVFFKPRFEGSSLGVGEENLISDLAALNQFLQSKFNEYSSWICESYLPGEEWTLAVIGSSESGYKASKVARIGLENSTETIYGEITKTKLSMPEKLHFDLDKERTEFIQKYSLELCKLLKPSGAVRLDWKADAQGKPMFLEWNLTPGLSSYYSSFPICYSRSFGTYSDLMKELLGIAREEFLKERFLYSKLKREKQTSGIDG